MEDNLLTAFRNFEQTGGFREFERAGFGSLAAIDLYDSRLKLCYIRIITQLNKFGITGFAWFTTQDLEKQKGNHWNRRFDSRETGPPIKSGGNKHEIVVIGYYAPHLILTHSSTSKSVREINDSRLMWLRDTNTPQYTSNDGRGVFAGDSVKHFVKKVTQTANGRVFLPCSRVFGHIQHD